MEYGGLNARVASLLEEIEELDVRGEIILLNDDEVRIRKEKFSTLWKLLKAKDSLVFQRSRVKWLKEGDANTKYFHNCLKARTSGNSIKALKVNGDWVQSPIDVRMEVVDYFKAQVSALPCTRPTLDGVIFERLTEDDNRVLIGVFSGEEIEEVVMGSDGTKSSGPDGFNFAFIKKFSYLMKDEVRIMFDQFHANGVILKNLLAYL